MATTTEKSFFKKNEPSAENVRCQKCLQKGHWTYECTGKRKYVYRPSRTKEMAKRLKQEEENQKIEMLVKSSSIQEKKKYHGKDSDSSSSSSDTSSDSSSSSTSNTSSSSSSDSSNSESSESSGSDSSSSSCSSTSSEDSSDAKKSSKYKKHHKKL